MTAAAPYAPADSLPPRIDRSDALPLAAYGTADSLREPFPIVAARRDTTAQAVFGQASTLVPPPAQLSIGARSLTQSAVFQGLVLLLAATYALLLYHHLSDVRTLINRISRDTASGKRLFDDPSGSGFSRFMKTATAIGILFLGVITVKYGDTLIPDALLATLSHGAALVLSLAAALTGTAVILAQAALLRLTGAVVIARPFIAQLQTLRQIYFSLAVIVISPALLLFALCPRGEGGGWFLLIVIELTITIFLYLRETLTLFISKKVSILHWFLYLCGVELFPISLLWLIAAR